LNHNPVTMSSSDSDSDNEVRAAVSAATPATAAATVDLTRRKKCCEILKANPLYPNVSAILHWRDPVKSGLLFGILNLFYILVAWCDYSVITLVSYSLLTLLVVCLSYVLFVVQKARFLQGRTVANPFQERWGAGNFRISRATAEQHLDTVVELINSEVECAQEVFYCTNLVRSLQYVGVFYLAAVVGNWFSGWTLTELAVIAAFVWPRTYEMKKKEIDQLYALAQQKFNVYLELVLSKLPPQARQLIAKTKKTE